MKSRGYAELVFSIQREGAKQTDSMTLPVEADGMFPLDSQRAAEEEQRQRGHKRRVVHVDL